MTHARTPNQIKVHTMQFMVNKIVQAISKRFRWIRIEGLSLGEGACKVVFYQSNASQKLQVCQNHMSLKFQAGYHTSQNRRVSHYHSVISMTSN